MLTAVLPVDAVFSLRYVKLTFVTDALLIYPGFEGCLH